MLSELNPQQLKAATCEDPRILCLAGAGAGKTKTLLARIQNLCSKGVDPKSILALTFSNAAAFEMKERYKKLPGLDLSRGVPEFRTFHSFCYSLIIKNKIVRDRLGYTNIPEVCDDKQFKEIKSKIKLALNIKLTEDQLEGHNLFSRSDKDQYDLFKKALVKELKTANVITFDIMCYNVCELFERNDDSIQAYKTKYKHLLIDEMQDTDKRQAKFVESFLATSNVFLCGDCLQNIYAFRGCTNEYIKSLTQRADWTVIKLYKNYRSTTNICEFANKFSKSYSSDSHRIEMEGQRQGEDPQIIYGSCSSYYSPVDKDHLSLLIDKIKENPGECAILCRSNREVESVRKALTDAEIQYSSKSKSTDNVDILESALSNDYMLEWLSTKLEAKDYSDYIRLSTQIENPDIHWFLNNYGNREVIRKPVEKITYIRSIVSGDFSAQEKFDLVTKQLRIKSKCKFTGDDSISNKNLIEDIKNQAQALEECDVYAGTIHSVKGLEYDTVYVMGVDDKLFKLGSEEMNNLYYVAITRAKNKLIVFRR